VQVVADQELRAVLALAAEALVELREFVHAGLLNEGGVPSRWFGS
jgi:hypothetical protein